MYKIEASEERGLSPEEKDLATLFRLSYRYSQGSVELQKLIFTWLLQHAYLNPANLPERIPAFLTSISPPDKHIETSPEGRVLDLKKEWDDLQTLDTSAYDESKNLAAIAENFIQRDLTFTERNTRPNRNPNGIVLPDGPNDPYASFTRKYILQQHPAGHLAFNVMFEQVNDTITQFRPEDDTMQTLRRLEVSWEKHHSGESFYTPLPVATPTPLLQGV